MKYEFFCIPSRNPGRERDLLNQFCQARRIISVDKQFIADGSNSYWSFCISYIEEAHSLPSERKGKVDYREVLDGKDFAVFAKLRVLRKTLAEREGIPAYALFTNEQLASMVKDRVTSLRSLAEINGVGKARLEKYGDAFLEVLKNECSQPQHETPSN